MGGFSWAWVGAGRVVSKPAGSGDLIPPSGVGGGRRMPHVPSQAGYAMVSSKELHLQPLLIQGNHKHQKAKPCGTALPEKFLWFVTGVGSSIFRGNVIRGMSSLSSHKPCTDGRGRDLVQRQCQASPAPYCRETLPIHTSERPVQ